jgi:hypothetical protein
MSLDDGYQRKAEGQAASARAENEWLASAKAEIRLRVDAGLLVTAEDIILALGMPEAKGAVGTAFSHLARSKVIEWTGDIKPCTREQAHASDMRVWQRYTGKAAREAAVLSVVRRFMEPPDDVRFGTNQTKAEKHPATFAREIRKAWDQ